MSKLKPYLKFVVAAVGSAATWAVGTFAPDSKVWLIATAVLAVLTAAGVYAVPNKPAAAK